MEPKVCWCSPFSPRHIAAMAFCFATGIALFAAGAHLSYAHIEPQRARTLARDDCVRNLVRKKYGHVIKFDYEK